MNVELKPNLSKLIIYTLLLGEFGGCVFILQTKQFLLTVIHDICSVRDIVSNHPSGENSVMDSSGAAFEMEKSHKTQKKLISFGIFVCFISALEEILFTFSIAKSL